MLLLILSLVTPYRTTRLEVTLCEQREARRNPAADHDDAECLP